MIREDCCMYDPKNISCTGLRILVCSYKTCKFFKTKEQAEAQQAACRARLMSLSGSGAEKEETAQT